jgi:hypothetical protein
VKKRGSGRPFKKGESGNPRGRPRGSPFQRIAAEVVDEEAITKVVKAITIRAAAGDGRCASLLASWFPPPSFGLVKFGAITTPADAAAAAAKIAKGIVNGSIDVDVGQRAITALQSAAALLMTSSEIAALWAKIAILEARTMTPSGDDHPGGAAPWRPHVNGSPP